MCFRIYFALECTSILQVQNDDTLKVSCDILLTCCSWMKPVLQQAKAQKIEIKVWVIICLGMMGKTFTLRFSEN